jgi:rhodanese-related sulfurtransferase
MKVIVQFLSIGWILSLGFLACTGQTPVQQKTAQETIPLIENDDWQFVDVRTPAEVKRGFLKGTDYFMNFNHYDFENKVENLDKSRPVLMICRSGARSQRAAKLLLEKGFDKVYNLEGGLMRWRDPAYIVKK